MAISCLCYPRLHSATMKGGHLIQDLTLIPHRVDWVIDYLLISVHMVYSSY